MYFFTISIRPFLAISTLLALSFWPGVLWSQEDEKDPAAAGEVSEQEPNGQEASEPGDDEDQLGLYDEIEVRQRVDDLVGIAGSSSEGVVGSADLAKRPLLRPGELVETAPGVMATQHSGAGKANQYFLRGFNLDHGTDFSVRVAGVPVNQPSHGHGQGYTDLNFIIPEMVDRVRYAKGPYDATKGDFSAAGGVEMDLIRSLEKPLFVLGFGSDDYRRFVWADSTKLGDGDLLTAFEASYDDGPWQRENDFQAFKTLVRFSEGDAQRGSSYSLMGYDGDWLSSDQIPQRAIQSGLIDRFGLIDTGPRGVAERLSLSGERHRGTGSSLTQVDVFLFYTDFGLVSNSTYFLDDEEFGDQVEQADRRLATGFELDHTWLSSWRDRSLETVVGVQARYDDISNGLYHTSDLERLQTVREDEIEQLTAGPFVSATVRWSDKVRTEFGLRGDFYNADVTSDLGANSGSVNDFLLSPKLAVVLGPWRKTEFYLNYGHGFHSNDARGATLRVDPGSGSAVASVDPLVKIKGADVGFRTSWLDGLQTTLTAFRLELDSELIFVGDGSFTEASRSSRRQGLEWTNVYHPNRRVGLDFDMTWTDAEFTDNAHEGRKVPGAVGLTVAAGVSLEPRDPDMGVFGSLRMRYFADIPLVEDGSVEWGSSNLVNARLGYHFKGGLSASLEIFNLLDREDSEIQYYYSSRLPGEVSGGVEDVHLHPLEKRSARLFLTLRR